MKKNVYRGDQRVRCNTETARFICGSEEEGLFLYRTSHGDFFIHATKGPFFRDRPKRCWVEEEIFLVSEQAALEFCKQYLQPMEYEYLFEDQCEDSGPGRQPVAVTLPGGVVRRLDDLAKQKGVSRSRLVEEAILLYGMKESKGKEEQNERRDDMHE